MTYAVLVLGATSPIGQKISAELARQNHQFSRTAFLTSSTNVGPEEEAKHHSINLECVIGSASDPKSYNGFDILVSAVEDDACAQQAEYIAAAIDDSADLTHPLVREQTCFLDKIAVRKRLESHARTHPSLGYTYVMTGISSDLLLDSNMLGLDDDRCSAAFLGSPDARVSTTHLDDVAKVVVASLLPKHLSSLNMTRHIRFSGSTFLVASLFDAISYILQHHISITYQTLESSNKDEKQMQEAGDEVLSKSVSARRAIGFGGFGLEEQDGLKEYEDEVRPKQWPEIVAEFFH